MLTVFLTVWEKIFSSRLLILIIYSTRIRLSLLAPFSLLFFPSGDTKEKENHINSNESLFTQVQTENLKKKKKKWGMKNEEWRMKN